MRSILGIFARAYRGRDRPVNNFNDYFDYSYKIRSTNDVWIDLVEPAIGVITPFRNELSFKENLGRLQHLECDLASLRGLEWRYGASWLGGVLNDNSQNISLFIRSGLDDSGNLKGQLRKLIEGDDLVGAIYKPENGKRTCLLLPGEIDREIGEFSPELISKTVPLLCRMDGTLTVQVVAHQMTFTQSLAKRRLGEQHRKI